MSAKLFPILVAALIAYLLGNLNGSVCISALVAHDDVRKRGSGNAGLTNFFRSYGGWSTLLVILVDMLKTALACYGAGLMLLPYGMYREGLMIGALGVSLGHDFPALLGFRGGKGILSGLFIALVVDYRVALLILAVFAVAYFATQYVSLGSVLASAAFGVGFAFLYHSEPLVMACGIFMSLLAIFMHRQNLLRLIKGEERKTNLFKKEKE
jgi:glycerol-3-phosphate acyltransferase PlsY